MATNRVSASPSPPPSAPTVDSAAITSHRFAALRKVYTSALRATLTTNSYPNFASCFPTPATYCPRALEGVWKQLNTRLEEECLKDFEKGLGRWEQLIEDAKGRKSQHEETQTDNTNKADGVTPSTTHHKPMHLLSAQELHAAHLTPTLIRAENELHGKLDSVQEGNKDMMAKVEEQRAEMRRLVQQLEQMVEDVEGAAQVVENDVMRDDLRKGMGGFDATDEDVKMGG
ncbi:hypothetical protein LTR70_007973 [Exophiala xenobiotica]|uniref:MIND kinetochore complex component Nnf1 n=1 Tax=Lithohypha guttulata TaxID=1690604 RepID=A0ABR0K2F5_9EURO|nr:hypothetical protein LTR24_007819 [Lithohypha guttulata]KAK5312806.1 hypothetical protein LTR70_007973 [Exophiala xenobiotica]